MSQRVVPVKLKVWRKFLKKQGYSKEGVEGDHEKWNKPGMPRPVIFPNKWKELPPFFINTNLDTMGISVEDYQKIIARL